MGKSGTSFCERRPIVELNLRVLFYLNNYCQVLGQLKPAEALLVASYNRSDVLGTKYWVFMHFMDFIAHKLR